MRGMETETNRDNWTAAYRIARVMNRWIPREAARRCLSVDDACRKVGRSCHNSLGHSAAWLRTAGELRALGDVLHARQLVTLARKVRCS
jgi:hypothetical protein